MHTSITVKNGGEEKTRKLGKKTHKSNKRGGKFVKVGANYIFPKIGGNVSILWK